MAGCVFGEMSGYMRTTDDVVSVIELHNRSQLYINMN